MNVGILVPTATRDREYKECKQAWSNQTSITKVSQGRPNLSLKTKRKELETGKALPLPLVAKSQRNRTSLIITWIEIKMPTVILLDVSLSMTRRIACEGKETQLRELAREGVYDFFDQLAKKCRLEFTALVAFSSLWEIVHEFTRDFEALKKCCSSVNIYDKTCITTALSGVERLVMDEWGPAVPVNLILVTDGRVGTGSGSLKEILRTINTRTTDTAFPLPFPFPCFLTIACLSVPSDFTEHKPWYEKLLKLNKGRGEIILPETPLCVKSVQNAFRSIFQSHYNQYEGSLLCGNLKSQITMFPSPNFKNGWLDVLGMYRKRKEEMHQLHMPSELKIIGFLDIADVASPAYVSRHLVLPVSKLSDDNKEGINDKEETSGTFGITEEDGKTPSFCVLLHGSLKIEKMVAVVQLRYVLIIEPFVYNPYKSATSK